MPSDGRTPSSGCITVALGALAVLVGLPFLISALGSDDDDNDDGSAPAPNSTEAPPEDDAEPADVQTRFDDYTITYRVELFAGDDTIATETRTYRAPFQSEIVVTPGEPDTGAEPSERTTQVMGGTETETPSQVPVLLTLVPGAPRRAAHFGGDLDAAIDHGLIKPLGRRMTVASTDCDLYRTRSPLDTSVLEPPSADDHTDLCITSDGLVLREETHVAGTMVRRATATHVERAPVPADTFTLGGHRIPDAVGGGRVRQLLPDSTAPDVDHLLPARLPDGFEPMGRYVYVSDRPDTPSPEMAVERIATLVDVFVADGRVIVVENGHSETSQVPDSGGVEVDVPGATAARAFVRTNHNEVLVAFAEGRFVRLSGTVTFDELVDLARTLATADGSGDIVPASDELDVTGRPAPEDIEAHEHDEPPAGEHSHDGETHTHN